MYSSVVCVDVCAVGISCIDCILGIDCIDCVVGVVDINCIVDVDCVDCIDDTVCIGAIFIVDVSTATTLVISTRHDSFCFLEISTNNFSVWTN